MKCKTCGEPMTKIRHGEDQIKGWQCVPCMMSFAPEERADNWAVWWRDQCLCPGADCE